jgi:hypothetical protein
MALNFSLVSRMQIWDGVGQPFLGSWKGLACEVGDLRGLVAEHLIDS